MPKIEDTIEVQVPIRQAYNQWTQFEDFPEFMEVAGGQTRVNVQMDVDSESTAENVAGDLLGVVKSQVRGDLERFKRLIESRDAETGAWRGEVLEGETK